ncbi:MULTISPECIES: hypothetical protein [Lysobacter]|uniref:hypothetical protein n=1 Tax=Lysobacter TaxID=68 RepID=UPI0011C06768|nr:hypothetical protein [Lysobacter soli]MDG2518101.1 hypothetical protein [Lysobacter soli]UTA53348.1 hypothetical protein L3D22_13355 [Lysobacter soli]
MFSFKRAISRQLQQARTASDSKEWRNKAGAPRRVTRSDPDMIARAPGADKLDSSAFFVL